jgi:hypothetical protein
MPKKKLRMPKPKPLWRKFRTTNCNFPTVPWFIQMSDLIDQARIAVGRNLTANEWALYFPGVPYHKTFPEL